ncbi:hypothetical protein M0638_24995 [Roseomonas sp. NAR14]|uniref:Uncharacterized protein n=1 Tax=Roseomonas acroporae TaxID=2937791 RepID=A0A9X1YEJ4_9PROT|nr:hypothetical protein [Roseomonas acroporae]MCK8787628.1 hypothetical protein [Roseomonas acroporae]
MPMFDGVVLADHLSLDVAIHYRDAEEADTKRLVTIKQALGSKSADEDVPAFTHILGLCHLRNRLRHFRVDRIVDLVDPETGEIVNNPAIWIIQNLHLRANAPEEATRKTRRVLSPVRFENGIAAGWAFGVPEAFRRALDIFFYERVLSPGGSLRRELAAKGVECSPEALVGDRAALQALQQEAQKKGVSISNLSIETAPNGKPRLVMTVETQGRPAAYDFSVGDIFYDPPEARKLRWKAALGVLRRSVQVADVDEDGLKVEFCLYEGGKEVSSQEIVCDQEDLVFLLKTGELP